MATWLYRSQNVIPEQTLSQGSLQSTTCPAWTSSPWGRALPAAGDVPGAGIWCCQKPACPQERPQNALRWLRGPQHSLRRSTASQKTTQTSPFLREMELSQSALSWHKGTGRGELLAGTPGAPSQARHRWQSATKNTETNNPSTALNTPCCEKKYNK